MPCMQFIWPSFDTGVFGQITCTPCTLYSFINKISNVLSQKIKNKKLGGLGYFLPLFQQIFGRAR